MAPTPTPFDGIYCQDDRGSFERGRQQWAKFLEHQIRATPICRYHDGLLWQDMCYRRETSEREFQMTRQESIKSAGGTDCHLCDLFNSMQGVDKTWYMSFDVRRCRMTIGEYNLQSIAKIRPPTSTSIHDVKLLRITFPGSDKIRGQKPRIISAERIDYDLMSSWLNKCRHHHKSSFCQPQDMDITGFKVIDCSKRAVIEVSERGCQYVALSYVWGSGGHAVSQSLHSCPQTIEDAITVTTTLGFHYLWIDQWVCASSHRLSTSVLLTTTVY
jgi:hypothetical protein